MPSSVGSSKLVASRMSNSHGKHSFGLPEAAITSFLVLVLQNLYLATDVRGSNLTRAASVDLRFMSVVPVVAGCVAVGGMDMCACGEWETTRMLLQMSNGNKVKTAGWDPTVHPQENLAWLKALWNPKFHVYEQGSLWRMTAGYSQDVLDLCPDVQRT